MGAEYAKLRRERWAIGIVAVLVAVLTFFEAHLAAVGGTVTFSSNIIIFALINLNVIFVVLLIFLVTRNVFKILLDRRRNLLGAKLRSRLVLIFICFSLIPTMLLFIAATNITTTSIKSWIGGRVGQALTGAVEIAKGTPGGGCPDPFPGRRERRCGAVEHGRPRFLPAGSRIVPEPGARRYRPAFLREGRRSRPGRRGPAGGRGRRSSRGSRR